MDALCPGCRERLDLERTDIICRICRRRYARVAGIPILLSDPTAYLASCRQQIAHLEEHATRAEALVHQQIQRRDLLPSTQQRCRSIITALQAQIADVRFILAPIISLEGQMAPPSEPAGTPELLTYIHYLYRDWGWPAESDGENERHLRAVQGVAGNQSLGRLLVLGAGACRLAYDLHQSGMSSDTTVLDISPLLFLAAQTIVRGGMVKLREANAEIHSLEFASREWVLRAPKGPIPEDEFHFLFADGVTPPVASASFDTILTPWFIDIVPLDLRTLIGELHRILKPAGRWLNIGPLRYRPEIPIGRRFCQEEIFDLISRAGFHLEASSSDSMPYLVSKLNGRGKIEWVLSFAATKLANLQITPGTFPPDWLILPHLPIPTFSGQSRFSSEDPAEHIVATFIDGHRSINDIAAQIADQAGEMNLSMDQLREIVRRCLMDIHPAC
jgi:SAM-dependent methyltransferase/uncharacterized protein YbaR (Trm112 family)